jgi:hypothetical protein
MHIRHRPIDEIQEDDLKELIQYKDSETKCIDYKRELPKNDRKGTIDLLSDVSSFANASGGHLVYGMSEKNGIPEKLYPLAVSDPDAIIQQLEQKIRDGIAPRIQNIEIGEVRLSPSGSSIVIKIPKSMGAPHRVTFGGHDKFYSRDSRSKYPLDVYNLRSAFILSESIADKVRTFRMQRIEMILDESNTPVPLTSGARLVLHLVPLDAFDLAHSTNIKEVVSNRELLEPMGFGDSNSMHNFDGYLLHRPGRSDDEEGSFYLSRAYSQYFRNGIIESIRVLKETKEMTIIGKDIESWITESLPNYLELLKKVGISPPVLIMVSLLNARGYKIGIVMGFNHVMTSSNSLPPQGIVQEKLLFPEIMVQDYEDNIATYLHSIFQTMWNAGGWAKSPHRDT